MVNFSVSLWSQSDLGFRVININDAGTFGRFSATQDVTLRWGVTCHV